MTSLQAVNVALQQKLDTIARRETRANRPELGLVSKEGQSTQVEPTLGQLLARVKAVETNQHSDSTYIIKWLQELVRLLGVECPKLSKEKPLPIAKGDNRPPAVIAAGYVH